MELRVASKVILGNSPVNSRLVVDFEIPVLLQLNMRSINASTVEEAAALTWSIPLKLSVCPRTLVRNQFNRVRKPPNAVSSRCSWHSASKVHGGWIDPIENFLKSSTSSGVSSDCDAIPANWSRASMSSRIRRATALQCSTASIYE